MNRLSNRSIIKILIITNIVTVALFFSGHIQPDLKNRQPDVNPPQEKPAYSYKDNPQYVDKMSLYSVYGKKGKIVMLGNSITAWVDWSELLNRNDIINRGIGSDITEGFLSRMGCIYSQHFYND